MHMDEGTKSKYFLDALHFFNETQWLFNVPVTELLTKGILDAFPNEWLDVLSILENEELNEFIVKKEVKPEWPGSLKTFVEKSKRIEKLPIKYSVSPIEIPSNFVIKLNPKKQHEIMQVAHLIHTKCASQGIRMIVDFGAGLGYVCQLLHQLYGYRVLGLERNEANVNKARSRQKELYPNSVTEVKYACCDLTYNSVEVIETILKCEFQEYQDICLIGLHACGDLSIDASKIFCKMNAARLLIMISCCYHKLSMSKSVQTSGDEKQYFHNFPMSRALRNAIEISELDVGRFLRQPFLRLACQEPAERWRNMSETTHDEHAFYVLGRAVLQLYANQHSFVLAKRYQKGIRKSQSLNFETYVDDALLRYDFVSNAEIVRHSKDESCHDVPRKSNIIQLWNEHRKKLKAAEIYTGLQLILQAATESLVLQDRLYWLEEQGMESVITSVMDRCLSPRSHAIVSRKR